MNTTVYLPAEWELQSAVAIVWPRRESDWSECYDQVLPFFCSVAHALTPTQKVVVVTSDKSESLRYLFPHGDVPTNVLFFETAVNDTWIRDFGAITVMENGRPIWLDFQFNGWGFKYAACHDNGVTARLYASGLIHPQVMYRNLLGFVLEGGAIESDGNGTLLTTTHCLTAPNRNDDLTLDQKLSRLQELLGARNVISLNYGQLEGDDTDGHVDTLARFCPGNVIAYVRCDDPMDSHFDELKKMEEELKMCRNADGLPYRLVALPMADALYDGARRLPATYANFLITNKTVLLPVYGSDTKDETAQTTLQSLFPDRQVVSIDCRTLVTQNGALHCSTMQFPAGVF